MRLKVKFLKLKAGKSIAFIHEKDALKLGIHTGERIEIRKNKKKITAVIDLVQGFTKKGEIALSQQIIKKLKIEKGFVEVSLPEFPESSNILHQKLGSEKYSKSDLKKIISDIVSNSLTEAEIAYFISGVYHYGMSLDETLYLTKAILGTGKKISWDSKKIADKHSIGGVPGNRTTPIVVSICAAAGITIPKNSSRAITSASGTADTIESIAKVDIPLKEMKRIVKKVGACLVWGGSLGLAPADDKLIKIERLLRIDPEPQLIASILAKKLAAGSTHVLIDIPYGTEAKVNKKEAKSLERKFKKLGKKLGLKISVILTIGNQPIGNGIGPILEIKDILRVLKQDNPPKDLQKKSLKLAGNLLEMVGKSKKGKGQEKALEILKSGKALKKFEEIIIEKSESFKNLKSAKYSYEIKSSKTGKIKRISNKKINYLAILTGCPLDKSAGLYLYKHNGNKIKRGEKILKLYSESKQKLNEAKDFYKKSKPIIIS